ncbi:hypothetical protein [Streptomyces sp. 196(2019)]|uniref:hypothetical protein n=1 Tax=Streptomyces sp. 196(2019) TaxID=2683820 RepID=UPI0013EC35F2|nr:hypothetical protein [Streptomyces sp. 196(2019)]NGO84786.1 hypothetical protein [Streptomyces sp. 196(2019)]
MNVDVDADVDVAVEVDVDEGVGASVVGMPPGTDDPDVYEPEGYDPGPVPWAPGIVVLGVGGSVGVPAGGGGEGDG